MPLKQRIIVASIGDRYCDNPKYIVEELLKRKISAEIIWVSKGNVNGYPSSVKLVQSKNLIKLMYYYATSKVIIDASYYPLFLSKRKGQIVINTWHGGGLGIKKIGMETGGVNPLFMRKHIQKIQDCTDVFISNSTYITNLYRKSFGYGGTIYKCGYPKNDILFSDKNVYRRQIREFFHIPQNVSILLYAPTFRDKGIGGADSDLSVYNVDYDRLYNSLKKRFSSDWVIFVKYHPRMQSLCENIVYDAPYVLNVTSYCDIQSLIIASDILLSDYSSSIFDAGTMGINCLTYATDFDNYKNTRGVNYNMHDLPFPYATNNDELEYNILHYDENAFKEKWALFVKKEGVVEKGVASKLICNKIIQHINGHKVNWKTPDL